MLSSEIAKKKTIEKLNSDNIFLVLETIRNLREHGNSWIIPEVIRLLKHTSHNEVEEAIKKLLYDLKDSKSIPYLINAICDVKYLNNLNILVSACWQNGLSYEDHFQVFVKLIVKEAFEVAFEAFTVIDNMEGALDMTESQIQIDYLKDNLSKVDESKKMLLVETIDILKKHV